MLTKRELCWIVVNRYRHGNKMPLQRDIDASPSLAVALDYLGYDIQNADKRSIDSTVGGIVFGGPVTGDRGGETGSISLQELLDFLPDTTTPATTKRVRPKYS